MSSPISGFRVREISPTEHFALLTKDTLDAGVPGTLDFAAAGQLGAIHVPQRRAIDHAHLHIYQDGTTGSLDLEIWSRTDGADPLLIATLSQAAGGGQAIGGIHFVWVSDAHKLIEGGHGAYLFLQTTSKMGGTPLARVDIHWVRRTLPAFP